MLQKACWLALRALVVVVHLFQALPPFLLLSMLWPTAPLRLFLSNLRDILFV